MSPARSSHPTAAPSSETQQLHLPHWDHDAHRWDELDELEEDDDEPRPWQSAYSAYSARLPLKRAQNIAACVTAAGVLLLVLGPRPSDAPEVVALSLVLIVGGLVAVAIANRKLARLRAAATARAGKQAT